LCGKRCGKAERRSIAVEQISDSRRLVVIGGGITGLAAAHRLVERSGQGAIHCEVRLLEAGSRLGGAISTTHRDGFILESGPDAFITTKPWALGLVRRLGLSERLIGTSEKYRRTFVVRGGRLHPLPEGFLLLAPTRIGPFLRSGLLSWRGKARTALDLVLPRRRSGGDESLASFVRRRFGQEVLSRLAQPMVGGIYTADPERLSLRATMAQFLEMEERDRSIILALRRQQSTSPRQHASDSGPRYSLFATMEDGLETLVEALAKRLPEGAVRLRSRVAEIADDGGCWGLRLADGTSMRADGIIVSIPAFQAALLTRGLDSDLARGLAEIAYASSLTVNMAYRREEISHPLDGFGFVVPAIEGRAIIACSFSSVKFPNRAPAEHVLLRAFAGGALQPQPFDWDDRTLMAAVRRDLDELLGIRAAPLWSDIVRHPHSMPQYYVGHLARVAALERRLVRWPTLKIAGNAYRGIGIPDSIHSGEKAADALLADMASPPGGGRAGAVT
jgi:oxygen-dependent protoporphyrinogen oxidase